MLIEFSVENYRSIQERQTLSMVASEDEAMLDSNTFPTPNSKDELRLITSAVIYGANASGKSNLLRGMQTLKRLVVDSASKMQVGTKLPIESFRLNSKYKNQPTSFEIIFIHQDIRFEYGVLLTRERVYEEWLIAYPNERPQNWFSRKYVQENSGVKNNQEYKWSFGRALKGEKQSIKKLVRSNSLFLSHAAQNNHEQLTQIFEWFQSEFNILTPNHNIFGGFTSEICDENDIFRKQVVKLLSEADIGISNLKIEQKSFSDRENSFLRQYIIKELTEIQELEGDIDIEEMHSFDIKTLHKMNDSEQEVEFEIEEESDGTQRLFELAGLWLYVLQHGEILIVDELGRSLHPVLTKSLIKMFNNPEINQNNAQIIFTIHDTTLLDTEIFRQDQIWFTEKNKSATKLYSLLEFLTREDESLQKGYLLGRYGAVPFINGLSNIDYAENEVKTNSQLQRRKGNKKPRKYILIVVEGQETEYNYFNSLKDDLKLKTTEIKVARASGGSPLDVVEKAESLLQEQIRLSKKQGQPKYDEVICVFDQDNQIKKYNEALIKTEKKMIF